MSGVCSLALLTTSLCLFNKDFQWTGNIFIFMKNEDKTSMLWNKKKMWPYKKQVESASQVKSTIIYLMHFFSSIVICKQESQENSKSCIFKWNYKMARLYFSLILQRCQPIMSPRFEAWTEWKARKETHLTKTAQWNGREYSNEFRKQKNLLNLFCN